MCVRHCIRNCVPAAGSGQDTGICETPDIAPFAEASSALPRFPVSKSAEPVQRPNTEHDFAHNLLLRHATDSRMSGIHRCGPVITHDENLSVRHLERELDIGITKGFFRQIWFIQKNIIY